MQGWRFGGVLAADAAASDLVEKIGIYTGAGIGTGTAAAFIICLLFFARGYTPHIARATAWTAGFGATVGLFVAIIDHVVY